MSTPAGVTRRECTAGIFSSIESGDDLGAWVTIKSTRRHLVWAATGEALVSEAEKITVNPGEAASIALIPTDLPGWLINGAPVDVTDGKQSHAYDITIQAFRVVDDKQVRSGRPFHYPATVIPSGDTALDLDLSVPWKDECGRVVSIPQELLHVLRYDIDQTDMITDDQAATIRGALRIVNGTPLVDDGDGTFTAGTVKGYTQAGADGATAAAIAALDLGTAATHAAGDFDTSGAAAAAQTAAETFATDAVAGEAARAMIAEGLAAQKAANLADLDSAAAARTNLGLGSAALLDASDFDAAGTAASEVAAEAAARAAGDALLIPLAQKGAPNGVATLDSTSKVPAAQLPSYVDDVLEYANLAALPATGETGKIYVTLDTNLTYRWSGSGYVEISKSLALGTTSSTAYPGDQGAANAAAIATETSRATAAEATAVHQTGNESVGGTKTFTNSPVVPTPTAGDSSAKTANTAFVSAAIATQHATDTDSFVSGRACSTDGTDSLPTPTGVGLEFVITTTGGVVGLNDIRFNGTSL